MSFLTPWFLAGGLAIAGPIIFHLIRRAARERTTFSSLMFLTATPPRAVRRRRLEHLWLLLLRCLCLVILATGFARPFLSKDRTLPETAADGRQLILLVDVSASMRRAGVWEKARAIAERYLEKSSPSDQVAVMTFDRQLHPLVSLAEWTAWPAEQRSAMARQRLAAVSPGWLGTQLGLALISAADLTRDNSTDGKAAKNRVIILISDLQEGAKLDGLQGHEWPADTRVMIERVAGNHESNAGLEILEPSANATSIENDVHVRLANSGDSQKEKFRLDWDNGGSMDIYLPPGQSRTFTAPKPPANVKTAKLHLSGDDVEFDNAAWFAMSEVENLQIAYLGTESSNDASGQLYYLQRVFPSTPRRQVQLVPGGSVLLPQSTFAVVPGKLAPEECAAVRDWLSAGKSALLVLTNADTAPTLAALLGLTDVQVTEASGDYALLGQIDFKHPIFAPFDDPRFSDFSHIHFWKHRRWEIPSSVQAQVLAKFDDGSPELTLVGVGKGDLLVLASGWSPADSQLAVSSKFPPLMQMMLQYHSSTAAAHFQFRTGDVIPSPSIAPGTTVQWQKPDGKNSSLAGGAAFVETDMPGIYRASWEGHERQFAVNLPLEESRIAPLSQDELARLGVPLGPAANPTVAMSAVRQRQALDADLENRQKMWRWLLAAALALLVGEIFLGGWLARRAIVTGGAT